MDIVNSDSIGMDLPSFPVLPGAGDLVNPLGSQFGHLSLQDKAFLDAFNRQEQQELHGVPRPGPVDPTSLLGQLEQVRVSPEQCLLGIKYVRTFHGISITLGPSSQGMLRMREEVFV